MYSNALEVVQYWLKVYNGDTRLVKCIAVDLFGLTNNIASVLVAVAYLNLTEQRSN